MRAGRDGVRLARMSAVRGRSLPGSLDAPGITVMPFLSSRLAFAGALLSPVVAAPLNAQSLPASDNEDILVVGQQARDTLTTPNSTGSRLGLTPLETPATHLGDRWRRRSARAATYR